MITWSPHPFLPHDEGRINGVVVARCGRSCTEDGSPWLFMANLIGTDCRRFGSTMDQAEGRLDAIYNRRVSA